MAAENLRLGSETLELKLPGEEVAMLSEKVANSRKRIDDQARDLLLDASSGPLDSGLLQDRFKSAAETVLAAPFARYSETFVGLMVNKGNPKVAEADRELQRLRGQIVLDLGNGRNPKLLQGFLTQYGIKAYLGVDTHNILGQNHGLRRVEKFGDFIYLDKQSGDIVDGALVRGDMLRVASSLPDESVSIALCGIDNYVVNTQSPYGMRLVEEVYRISNPAGLIFGIQGPKVSGGILNELIKKPDIQEIGPDFPGFIFLRKNTVK
jgi:hypothetical protein